MDTVIAEKQLVCPNCEAVGVIEGVAPEVVPKQIQCLACHSIFPFQPSRYDVLRQDYDGKVEVALPHGALLPHDSATCLTMQTNELGLCHAPGLRAGDPTSVVGVGGGR